MRSLPDRPFFSVDKGLDDPEAWDRAWAWAKRYNRWDILCLLSSAAYSLMMVHNFQVRAEGPARGFASAGGCIERQAVWSSRLEEATAYLLQGKSNE